MKRPGKTFVLFGVLIITIGSSFNVLCADTNSSSAASQSNSCSNDPACQRSDWKEEFERICTQTELATTFKPEQLQKLISDSDELMARLKGLQDSQVKIYLFRLRNCRNFFIYALQLQGTDGEVTSD